MHKELEKILGHVFSDKNLLETAFTHSSFAAEQGGESNERLEFLGDAVLELICTEQLYKNNPKDEGELTKLRQQYVSRAALEEACDRAGLMKYLRFCGNENNIAGKTKSNLFEAALGALYLDGGLPAAEKFCAKYLRFTEQKNYKSLLQELVQEETKGMPLYETAQEGEKFLCTVSALGERAQGEGASKQAAETEAARKLYEKIGKGRRN